MADKRGISHDLADDDITSHSMLRGIDYIRDPHLNKGMAFSLEERQTLCIHGLLPPVFRKQEEQIRILRKNLDTMTEPLNKYIFLSGLQDRHEKLFYRLLSENIEEYMPVVYTPTVGLACQRFGLIFRRPHGLFISIHDKGHIYHVLKNWPEKDIRAICVTDGERILGLGDLGAYGMGIPVGKLSLYTALAGIKPHQCLPIMLDVGTNNKDNLADPFYTGNQHERVTGDAYDEFVDEFMSAVVRRYGQNILIQFEDFANHNAFRFLDKYRDKYCTFNDDIQGTASVAVAGILAALRHTKTSLRDHVFLFQGAGEAALGIASLLEMAMKADGMTQEEARGKIFLNDYYGFVTEGRPDGHITDHMARYQKKLPHVQGLEKIVNQVKPTAIIGASAQGGAFTTSILQTMAKNNERPIIFALSNPTHKAECTAEAAYTNTDGKCVFVSGSPFDPVEYGGRTFHPGQGNNAYIFPGVALGVICSEIHHISDDVFLRAAKALADMVTEEDLEQGRMYPPLQDIRKCSVKIATYIAEHAYRIGLAAAYPEPPNKRKFIIESLYNCEYENAKPMSWSWPANGKAK